MKINMNDKIVKKMSHQVGSVYFDTEQDELFLIVYNENLNEYYCINLKTGKIDNCYGSLKEIDECCDNDILVDAEININKE